MYLLHPVNSFNGHQLSGTAIPTIVNKDWGYELIYKNNNEYCSKLLYIKEGCYTSMHYHIEKHETIVVTNGKLLIDYLDQQQILQSILLVEGQAFIVGRSFPHRLRSFEGPTTLIESSTYDRVDDSIRIIDG